MHKQSPEANAQDRRRFAFAHAGELWMSDVMHGPSVSVPGRGWRMSCLIAFLDDATRVVPYCAFTLSENTQAFLPVFKQALMRRGLPQRLYGDKAANYRAQHLALVCARLATSATARPRTIPIFRLPSAIASDALDSNAVLSLFFTLLYCSTRSRHQRDRPPSITK
jgi:transposase InsO family protein